MKRLVLLCAIAAPLFGLTRPVTSGDRIGVLRMSSQSSFRTEQAVAKTILADLPEELSLRGFRAFDAGATFEEAQRGGAPAADYYVDVVSSAAGQRPLGGVGAAVGRVGVDIEVVVSHVAAEVRLYDGRTMQLVQRYDLHQRKAAVIPAGIALGGRSIWGYIALPFVQYGQYRLAAHDVAREAADRIASR